MKNKNENKEKNPLLLLKRLLSYIGMFHGGCLHIGFSTYNIVWNSVYTETY